MRRNDLSKFNFSVAVDRFATILSQMTIVIMVLTVLCQVFMRYFLRDPLVWGDELAKYSLAYMTFIGAAVALRNQQLASMDMLVSKLSNKSKKIIFILVYALEICLLIFLLYYSTTLISQDFVKEQLSPALQVPMGWVYFCMPLGLSVMLIQVIMLLWQEIIEIKSMNGGNGE
ncbi:MAG: hypothetical protein PWQ70_2928 [Clostridiales bacterium]|nr:hypothetical protein [Clostridiales bacterium]